MKLSVFVRTYRSDFDWIPYCLDRIRKHIKYHEIVVCTPHAELFNRRFKYTDCKVIKSREFTSGYLAQQSDKLNAWQWCEGDVIMYVDSDTMFYKDVCVEDFIFDGRINLLRTQYSQIHTHWQDIVANAIGFKSDWEYMRRFPLLYWKQTLVNINAQFPNIHTYINSQQKRLFSEFNFIGQFIERFEYHRYNLLDTNDGVPQEVCKQFRCWNQGWEFGKDKLLPEQIKQIECLK